jgi:hypothetical protein
MAVSNLQLNVTANTARALADFNKFSRSLDNKFLVSGLKLDVVRSALNQINRDFQRAIGEQGLASASSFRAAQNQAALLTQTFKAFSAESALAITNNIGTALNRVAVTAGGTMKDVQKTLLATPFISTRLGDDVRLSLTKGVMDFQKNFRRAGLGDNFGDVAQQFLMGGKTTMQMVQSGNAMEMFLGSELIKRGAGVGEIASPEMRSKLLRDLVEDSALGEQLEIAARRTAGFRIVLEDLNTTLFNPEAGVFGALRSVVDSAGKSTTMFDEVEVLVEQVFGDSGLFATLVKAIREVFGAGDPMRPFIDAVQFMTGVFKSITDYFNTPGFRAVLGYVKDIIDRVTSVFTGIYRQIRSGGFSAEEITRTIGGIGESIRGYIRKFGEAIRGEDISKESSFTGDIIGTLVEEVGKTAVVLIKELFMTMVNKVPEIVTGILPALNKGINGVLTEAFGSAGAAMVKFIAGFIPHPVGAIARASAVGDVTGGGGSVGSMLAMGAGALLGPGALFGAARVGRGVMGGDRARMGLLTDLTRRTNRVEEVYNRRMRQLYMPSAQRVPLSGMLGRFLSPRTAFASPVSFPPGGGGGFGGYRFPTDPMMGPSTPLGQITSRTSALAGTMPYDIPSSRLFQTRFGRITPETSMFRPYVSSPPDPRRITRGTTMFQPPTGRELFPFIATGRPRTGTYNFPTEGPMQIRRPTVIGDSLHTDDYLQRAEFNREIRDRESVRRRFSQRYGRTALIRAQTRRALPGFGRGADLGGMFPSAYGRRISEMASDNEDGLFDRRLSRTPSPETIDRFNRRYGVRGRMSRIGGGMFPSAYGRRISEMASDNEDGLFDRRLSRTPSPETIDRFNRRYGVRGRMSRIGGGLHRVGMGGGYLMAGSMAADLAGQAVGGAGGQILSGAGQGAMMGATIGSIIPGVGTAAGAVIGGIIGGVAPLMDKGVRDEVGKFIASIGTGFNNTVDWFVKGTQENWGKARDSLGSAVRFVVNGLISVFNNMLSTFQVIPRLIVNMVEGAVNTIPGANLIPGVKEAVEASKSVAYFQIPTMYAGKDYAGPAMALEARMSGRKPMIVNDGEFVIPRDGFPTLVGLVGNSLQSTGVISSGPSQPIQVNVNLSVTANSVVANADELATALRDPVYKIIGDAWNEAYNANRVHRPYKN